MSFYKEPPSSGLVIAQVIGLTSAAFVCGKTFSQSWTQTPALLMAPAPLLVKQWKKMFDSDKLVAPAVVTVGGAITGFLAYQRSYCLHGNQ